MSIIHPLLGVPAHLLFSVPTHPLLGVPVHPLFGVPAHPLFGVPAHPEPVEGRAKTHASGPTRLHRVPNAPTNS